MSVKLTILTDCGHEVLDIDQSKQIPLNFALSDFTRLGGGNESTIRVYYSSAIDIPMTNNNCRIFGTIPDTSIKKAKEIISSSPVAYLEEGVITYVGVIRFLSSKKENGISTINVQFSGSSINFFSLLPKYLADLPDFGCHTFNTTVLGLNFQNPDPYDPEIAPFYYGLKNFGKITGDFFPITSMRPDIFIAAIIDQIEIYTGIKIKSKFFQTEFFKRLLIGSYDFSSNRYLDMFTSTFSQDWLSSGFGKILPTTNPLEFTNIDTYGISTTNGINDNILFDMPFDFQEIDVKIKFHISVINTFGFIGFSIRDEDNVNLGANGATITTPTATLDFEVDGTVRNNKNFYIAGLGSTVQAGSYFTICVNVKKPTNNFPVCCNEFLGGKLETTKFLRGLVDLFNLQILFNSCDNELIIEPKYNYTIPTTGEEGSGFFNSNGEMLNLSNKFDCNNSEFEFSLDDSFNRKLNYKFKDDNKDTTTDDDTFADVRILSKKFKDDDTDIENTFFAATTDEPLPSLPAIDANEVIVPTFRNYEIGEDEKENFDIIPRIYYKIGNLDGEWNFGVDDTNFVTLPQYPKITQQNNEFNINLGYADTETTKGLVSVFRKKDLEIYNNGIGRTITVRMKIKDLICIDDLFEKLVWIDRRYIINNISMNLGDELATIELISFDI